MKITYWADFACPYCYIGETRLLKAVKKLGMEDSIELQMKSYELNPDAPKECTGTTAERYAKSMKLGPKGAEYHVDRVSRLGRMEGLEMDYAKSRYTNTLDAHRLLKAAQLNGDKETTEKLINNLFDAYFAKGLELSDRDTLIKIGVESGLAKNDIINILESDKFTDEVRADEKEADEAEVYGVPLFIIGNKRLEGAVEENAFITAVNEAMKKEHNEDEIIFDEMDLDNVSHDETESVADDAHKNIADENHEHGCSDGVCRL